MRRNKIVLITGGMGAGKSTISKQIEQKGYGVYYSDDRVKTMLKLDKDLQHCVSDAIGSDYSKQDNKTLAEIMFESKQITQKVNNCIEPKFHQDLLNWSKLDWKDNVCFVEAAPLRDMSYDFFDSIIFICTEKEERIKRVLQRDPHRSREQIELFMENQMSNDEICRNLNKLTLDTTCFTLERMVDLCIEHAKSLVRT